MPPGLEATSSNTQDAFRRFGALPCGRVMLPALPVTFLPTASHPFARRVWPAPRQGIRAAAPRYSEATLVRLSARLGASETMLQTDFCNRHLARAPTTIARLPSPRLAPRDHTAPSRSQPPACAVGKGPVLPRDAVPPFGNPAPAGTRLTARLQLRTTRSLRCLPLARPAPWGSPIGDPTSWWRCRPRTTLASVL
jgi:hypothetical protein